MSKPFPCTSCGACCKSVLLSELTAALDRGDGTCRYFDDALSICTIYDDRPDICNIQLTYEQYYKHNISWPKFVELNLIACEDLLKQQTLVP